VEGAWLYSITIKMHASDFGKDGEVARCMDDNQEWSED